jgi:hypothetical protein
MAIATAAGAASGQNYIETFENGVNAGGWTIVGGAGGGIQPAGGNPGAYFGGTAFDYPDVQTTSVSAFSGDYFQRRVATVGGDFITNTHQGAIFPMTLMLVTDAGTPGDPGDDWGAYQVGSVNVPEAGQGWRSIFFTIESQASGLPFGWAIIELGGNPPPVRTWPALMRGVSQVRFLYAPPGTVSNFPVWSIGVDNMRIFEIPPSTCYANCDGSLSVPILNVNDFICFQARFAAGDSYANCDASTFPPVLNINDFLCFQSRFAAGCSAP